MKTSDYVKTVDGDEGTIAIIDGNSAVVRLNQGVTASYTLKELTKINEE